VGLTSKAREWVNAARNARTEDEPSISARVKTPYITCMQAREDGSPSTGGSGRSCEELEASFEGEWAVKE